VQINVQLCNQSINVVWNGAMVQSIKRLHGVCTYVRTYERTDVCTRVGMEEWWNGAAVEVERRNSGPVDRWWHGGVWNGGTKRSPLGCMLMYVLEYDVLIVIRLMTQTRRIVIMAYPFPPWWNACAECMWRMVACLVKSV